MKKGVTVAKEEAPANYVPAAAVKHRGQALSGITGCKRACRRVLQVRCEIPQLNCGAALKTANLECGRGSGIPSVAVKCVDIRRNTSGEGDLLGRN